MAALATRPLTLLCDLDLLLSSASPNDETSGAPVPEPSFTYTVGERPSPAHASPTARPSGNLSDSLAQQESSLSNPLLQRHAWLRPGVRRFLLAVNPHFKTVLLVRRRCSARQPCCCNGGARFFSDDGSHRICDLSDGGSGDPGPGTRDLALDIGGCSASLLAAALPNIDQDGQFFGQRVVLIQDQLRPRTAQSKFARGSCPSGEAAAPAGPANTAAGQSLLFPARARDLSAVAAALGEHPSTVLVVTPADRSLFGGGSLADQVIECQPYRTEYGKYDDVLDCLATVVTGLLAEASVPLGLRRLGLLHSRVQASPLMQTLHAQAALRRHQAPQGQGRAVEWAPVVQADLTVPAAVAALPPLQRQQQYAGAAVRKSGSRSSGGGRRHTDGGGGGGGDGGRPTGSASTGPISGSSTSPLAPIPELPLLEVDADWNEGEDEPNSSELPLAAAAAVPLPGPSSGRGSATAAASSPAGDSGGNPPSRASPSQCRSISSPSALCAASEPIGVNRSSAGSTGSTSSRSSSSGGGGGGGGGGAVLVVAAVSPPPPGGRRMAWDAAPASEGAAGPTGGLVAVVDSSAAASMLQSLKPPLTPGSAGGGGFGRLRGSGSGGGGEPGLGWRPRSFPAATKPPVTRLISDCASHSTGGGVSAVMVAAAAPASPLSTAASSLAAATSRLLARILGGRRQRRCRPSDVGEAGGGGCDEDGAVLPPSAAVAAVMPCRSAVSATGDLGFFVSATAPQHARAASTSAPTPPKLSTPDRYFAVRQASASGSRVSADEGATAVACGRCATSRGGVADPSGEPPSRSAASATAAASTPAAATKLPYLASQVSQASQSQPWGAAVDGCVSRQSPPPPRTPRSADGCEPAPATAAAGASMRRSSEMGGLSQAARSDQTDLLLQQQQRQQQIPEASRAAARARAGEQSVVGAAVSRLLSPHGAGVADQRKGPSSSCDGGLLSTGREASGRTGGVERCSVPVMVVVGAAPVATPARVSFSDAGLGAVGAGLGAVGTAAATLVRAAATAR